MDVNGNNVYAKDTLEEIVSPRNQAGSSSFPFGISQQFKAAVNLESNVPLMSSSPSNDSGGGGLDLSAFSDKVSQDELHLMEKKIRSNILRSVGTKVEVLRQDPKSPLYSAKTFEELRLPESLLKGLYEMGFQAPSKIQETALPILLANPPQNMVAQSQSGTGKTAAFLLASLYRINVSLKYPQVLILCPTYELANQLLTVAQQMAKYIPAIQFIAAVRGSTIKARDMFYAKEMLTQHIIIGTPGEFE